MDDHHPKRHRIDDVGCFERTTRFVQVGRKASVLSIVTREVQPEEMTDLEARLCQAAIDDPTPDPDNTSRPIEWDVADESAGRTMEGPRIHVM